MRIEHVRRDEPVFEQLGIGRFDRGQHRRGQGLDVVALVTPNVDSTVEMKRR
jgi:hypothetical protein